VNKIEPNELHHGKCIPCEGGTNPLTPSELGQYARAVPQWNVSDDNTSIARHFKLKDFEQALKYVNAIAALATCENHHPDLYIHGWNKLTVTLSTHAIGGLSTNDFVMAAKIDHLPVVARS